MDLIDRGKFWDNLNDEFEMGVTDAIEAVNNALDDTPAVDAVPVIRCRDCIHFLQYTKNAGDCNIWENEMKICDFCSYGEPVEKPVESVDNLGGINND